MWRGLAIAGVLLLTASLGASGSPEAPDAETCLGCHDFGPQSPVHGMLGSPHGDADDAESPMANAGCVECHGPSLKHARSPTRMKPSVSFGPRWTEKPATQDAQCLDCHTELVHEGDAATSPIPEYHVGCATCHELHVVEDPLLTAEGQKAECTVCHKSKFATIHGLEADRAAELGEAPACALCHAPHRDSSPVQVALENRSAGCTACHDLVAMNEDPAVSEKAKDYHRVMASEDRTCLDCHGGIAHNVADGVRPTVPAAAAERSVTLFRPGQSHSEWLFTEHPGSQPLRQDAGGCQLCHRGEEAELAEALASGDVSGALTRDLHIAVARVRDGGALEITLDWPATAADRSVAVMWADDAVPAAARGGCFAACHSDMPGMERDRGQDLGKYLSLSRQDMQQVGRPRRVRPAEELKQLRAEGRFTVLWRVSLEEGDAESAEAGVVLERVHWGPPRALEASAVRNGDRWEVRFLRELGPGAGGKVLDETGRYTIGIALHEEGMAGAGHWISLPMTLGLTGDDTDLRAR